MIKQTNDEASGKESILHFIKPFLLYMYVRETKLYHPDLLQCKWSAETREIDTLVKVACTSTHLTIINTCVFKWFCKCNREQSHIYSQNTLFSL